MALRFGDLEVDLAARRVRRAGAPEKLSPKAFELLALLVASRPRAVAKAEILESVWPKTFVSEGNLAALVNEIRRALGETARQPRLLRTVHGFGYAFDAPAEPAGDAAAPTRHVLVVAGGDEVALHEGENVAGRDRTAEIWLGDASVSRRHARFVVEGDGVRVEDLGSKNGTRRNDERVSGVVTLRDGDEVRCGDVRLRYRDLRSAGQSSTRTARR